MLTASFIVLGIAVLLGSGLAVLHLREGTAAPARPLGALHGLVAIAGLGLLALAALIGILLLAARLRKRRLPGVLIGIHATFAVGGFVVLLAYVLAA